MGINKIFVMAILYRILFAANLVAHESYEELWLILVMQNVSFP